MTKRQQQKEIIEKFKISQTKIAEMSGMNHFTFRSKNLTNIPANSFSFKEQCKLDDVFENLANSIMESLLWKYPFCQGVLEVSKRTGESMERVRFEYEDGSKCNESIEDLEERKKIENDEKNKKIILAAGGTL